MLSNHITCGLVQMQHSRLKSSMQLAALFHASHALQLPIVADTAPCLNSVRQFAPCHHATQLLQLRVVAHSALISSYQDNLHRFTMLAADCTCMLLQILHPCLQQHQSSSWKTPKPPSLCIPMMSVNLSLFPSPSRPPLQPGMTLSTPLQSLSMKLTLSLPALMKLTGKWMPCSTQLHPFVADNTERDNSCLRSTPLPTSL